MSDTPKLTAKELAVQLRSIADMEQRFHPTCAEVSRAAADALEHSEADRKAIIEECAKVCEERANARFNEHGIWESDTNASYYPKFKGWCDVADEEDMDCAAAIRALSEEKANG